MVIRIVKIGKLSFNVNSVKLIICYAVLDGCLGLLIKANNFAVYLYWKFFATNRAFNRPKKLMIIDVFTS